MSMAIFTEEKMMSTLFSVGSKLYPMTPVVFRFALGLDKTTSMWYESSIKVVMVPYDEMPVERAPFLRCA
eukprot:3784655-Prymnesium_polylepis.1